MIALVVAAIIALAAGSILRWSLTERRMNKRHALRLEARNAAEAAAEYAFAQVRQRLDEQMSFSMSMLDPEGPTPLVPPPTSVFADSHVVVDSVTVVGGQIKHVTNDFNDTHFYIDPRDANNQFDPMKGKRIFRRDVQILAQATVASPNIGSLTAYVGETLAMREAPMFAHAIFYNMDLELCPGSQMTIDGPVHTNGNLWIAGPYGSATLDFKGPVTVAGAVYGGYLTPLIHSNGSPEGGRSNPVRFVDKAGELKDLRENSGSWRDHKMGTGSETIVTQTEFREFTSAYYNGYLQSRTHGVEQYNPVAFGEYVPDPSPHDGVDQSVNSGRAMIEPPLASGEAGYVAAIESQKFSRKSGLYITVNPSSMARTGKKPDGTDIVIPAGEYRAFNGSSTEIILPGSTVATAGTVHPNPGGRPIIQIKPAAMTDMRRVTAFNPGANRSSGNAFDPKTIDIIEVDMTALKMAVDWSVNGANHSLVYDYDSSASDSTYQASTTTVEVLSTANHLFNFDAADWNGAIYVESIDAETRRDSGVRLINGRGRIASTPTHSAHEGLTIATNDALYILGHYNADGLIQTSTGSLTNSSRYPESVDEVPAAIAADAITILSQPTIDGGGTQYRGWNDGLSELRHSTSSYSSSWSTSNPSGSNRVDGSSSYRRASEDPTDNTSSGSANNYNVKFGSADTEVASALLMGLVPSNKNGSGQQSGGAHNFPRFIEKWSGRTLAMRGSMVALFESRIADEEFGIRYYDPPTRLWGFNEIFADGRYPPQTPLVRTYRRVDFSDLAPAEYAALLDDMEWEDSEDDEDEQ
ncbi:hypothetical protein [Synoicihabitans lomoniglobus]|uniref:Uncharacterized protein n=1 Tax=Synoicihabitans lomoniglobus TaxID=2909285 RepID=A0AAE9ZUE2_9BACT|nr:hypothetical protein [Opitutaceae bacterium LMO-M01]WED63476.1 hypothetical protein PXH66_14140 [Opitutaceae bacterium LMO-M01]